jgi:hypothetical protein
MDCIHALAVAERNAEVALDVFFFLLSAQTEAAL